MQKYRDIDHTGDLGVEVYGDSLPALFAHAAEAFVDIITDATTIRTRESRSVTLQAEDREALMVQWLNELVYWFETDGLLPSEFDITTLDEGRLEATIRGETYDADRHPIKTTVKGATYHQLAVVREEEHWKARIIFDL